jgi:hypothetical protein
MDPRIFRPELMGLGPDIHAKPARYRSERVAAWHAAREAGVKLDEKGEKGVRLDSSATPIQPRGMPARA